MRGRGDLDDIRTVTVEIDDGPAYESTRTFRGWPLRALLETRGDLPDDPSDHAVQFIATDGYRATVPLDELPIDDGVVAFRDDEAPEGTRWAPFPEGYGKEDPAPFYLVWPDAGRTTTRRPWAYELAAIGIARKRALWGAAFPAHDESLRDGFDVFREHCMKCHAINRAGGAVGPELNVPKNVTEYWKNSRLPNYIRHPRSFRAGSDMPAMDEELSEGDIEALLHYLRGMADAKVCTSAAECERYRAGDE